MQSHPSLSSLLLLKVTLCCMREIAGLLWETCWQGASNLPSLPNPMSSLSDLRSATMHGRIISDVCQLAETVCHASVGSFGSDQHHDAASSDMREGGGASSPFVLLDAVSGKEQAAQHPASAAQPALGPGSANLLRCKPYQSCQAGYGVPSLSRFCLAKHEGCSCSSGMNEEVMGGQMWGEYPVRRGLPSRGMVGQPTRASLPRKGLQPDRIGGKDAAKLASNNVNSKQPIGSHSTTTEAAKATVCP